MASMVDFVFLIHTALSTTTQQAPSSNHEEATPRERIVQNINVQSISNRPIHVQNAPCQIRYALPIQPLCTKKSKILPHLLTSICFRRQSSLGRHGTLFLTLQISRAAFRFMLPPCFIASFMRCSFITRYGLG